MSWNDYISVHHRQQVVVVDIDTDIGQAVVNLGSYANPNERRSFTAALYGLMLFAIATEDTSEALDGFERMLPMYYTPRPDESQHLWGDFLLVLNHFYDRYSRRDYLQEELRELLSGDMRVGCEEAFRVEFSRNGRILMIS